MKRSVIFLSLVCLGCFSGIGISASAIPELTIKAVLDQTNYRKGSPIGIALLIYTKNELSLTFNSAKLYDFKLNRESATVWQWSSGKMFAQSIVTRNFQPDQPLVFSEVIETSKLNLKPGKYTLTPILGSNPVVTGEPVSFQIK